MEISNSFSVGPDAVFDRPPSWFKTFVVGHAPANLMLNPGYEFRNWQYKPQNLLPDLFLGCFLLYQILQKKKKIRVVIYSLAFLVLFKFELNGVFRPPLSKRLLWPLSMSSLYIARRSQKLNRMVLVSVANEPTCELSDDGESRSDLVLRFISRVSLGD